MGMASYFVKRVLGAVLLVLVVIIVNFTIINLAPGEPVYILAGEMAVDKDYLAQIRKEFGLDRPLYERLIIYIVKVLQGNLGFSYKYQRPVIDLIAQKLPYTILLMGLGLFVASVLGIFLGAFASTRPHSKVDAVITAGSLVGFSMPSYWVSQILILIFVVYLRILPSSGIGGIELAPNDPTRILDLLYHSILPVASIAIYQVALISRVTRISMLENLRKNFVYTARAKGVREHDIIYRHVLRNSLLSVLSVISNQLGYMFAGAIVTETIFAWPGMGPLLIDAAFARDYPVLMGIFVTITIGITAVNLITDFLYGLVDPRVKYR